MKENISIAQWTNSGIERLTQENQGKKEEKITITSKLPSAYSTSRARILRKKIDHYHA